MSGATTGTAIVVPTVPAADDVKIALVVPLSGRWARQGQLKKMGAEVAERIQVPWLTLSYADSITERGFKYTFQTSPVSSAQAAQALDLDADLAKRAHRPLKKAAVVGDNTAATVFFFKPLREKLLAAKGIELVADEVWTPPLPNGTPIVQKLRTTQPDIVFYGATNFPDSIQVLQKLEEFGIKTHIQGVGAWLVTPEYVKTVGKEALEASRPSSPPIPSRDRRNWSRSSCSGPASRS